MTVLHSCPCCATEAIPERCPYCDLTHDSMEPIDLDAMTRMDPQTEEDQ